MDIFKSSRIVQSDVMLLEVDFIDGSKALLYIWVTGGVFLVKIAGYWPTIVVITTKNYI